MLTYRHTFRGQPKPEDPQVWELTCPGDLEEIGRARRWTRDVLNDSPHADDAALIVTELSTNALLHTDSGHSYNAFHLTLTRTPEQITITVTDSGGTRTKPRIKHPHHHSLYGRGLALVSALADQMEVRGNSAGHIVIATLNSQKREPADSLTTAATTATGPQPC